MKNDANNQRLHGPGDVVKHGAHTTGHRSNQEAPWPAIQSRAVSGPQEPTS